MSEEKKGKVVRLALPVAKGRKHHFLAREVSPGHFEVKRGTMNRYLDRLKKWKELQKREGET